LDAPWRIELFGRLQVTPRDRVVKRFRMQKVASLLAYLAFYRDRRHSRIELLELLWPECSLPAGRNRLKVALTSPRHQLEPPGVPAGTVIQADRTTVQLNPAVCMTDVALFEAACREGLTSSGRRSAAGIRRLTEAVERYRGPLLAGCFEEWIVPERLRLAELFQRALAALAGWLEEADRRNPRPPDWRRAAPGMGDLGPALSPTVPRCGFGASPRPRKRITRAGCPNLPWQPAGVVICGWTPAREAPAMGAPCFSPAP
jgi:two-component SAPR family response regulator